MKIIKKEYNMLKVYGFKNTRIDCGGNMGLLENTILNQRIIQILKLLGKTLH